MEIFLEEVIGKTGEKHLVNLHLDIKVVEVVASGGEVKETAIGHQGTSLDLQLLDQSCVSKKSLAKGKPGGGGIFWRQVQGPCQ